AARHVDDDGLVRAETRRQLAQRRDRVRALERRDDALGAAEQLERRQRVTVGHADVARTSGVLEPRVLGAHARIIQPGADRVRLLDLPPVVAQAVRLGAVEPAYAAGPERRRVPAGPDPLARRLDTDELDGGVADERMEQADRVGAAAHAGDAHVRQ